MAIRKENYVNMEKFHKTRNEQRKRYYQKTQKYGRHKWTLEEDKAVLEHKVTDTELSSIIKHSVAAIQSRRKKLKRIQKSIRGDN